MTIRLRAVHLRRIYDDIFYLATQLQHFGVRRTAQVKADAYLIADSIERAGTAHEAGSLDTAAQKRIAVQCVNGIDDSGTGINSVHAQMRLGAMRCQPTDFAFHQGAGRPVDLGDNLTAACHILRHYMITQSVLHIIQRACLQHCQRASADFLRRLAKNFHAAAGKALLLQQLGYAQSDSHMGIMTAGVNWLQRAILVFKQQAVHIGTHCYRRSRFTAVEHSGKCGSIADVFGYIVTKLTQKICQISCCLNFLEGRLRQSMQLGPDLINMCLNIHN